jgi:hypothetical protein
LGFLRQLGVAPAPAVVVAVTPVERLLERYRRRLDDHREPSRGVASGHVNLQPTTAAETSPSKTCVFAGTLACPLERGTQESNLTLRFWRLRHSRWLLD